MSLIIHEEKDLDKVKISIVITKENSTLSIEKTKDPNVEGIVHNKCDIKQVFKFEKMMNMDNFPKIKTPVQSPSLKKPKVSKLSFNF